MIKEQRPRGMSVDSIIVTNARDSVTSPPFLLSQKTNSDHQLSQYSFLSQLLYLICLEFSLVSNNQDDRMSWQFIMCSFDSLKIWQELFSVSLQMRVSLPMRSHQHVWQPTNEKPLACVRTYQWEAIYTCDNLRHHHM